MLRITVQDDGVHWRLQLSGKLAGAWVAETANVWCSASASDRQIEVDLREVTGVDASGRTLLAKMHEAGAHLTASGVATSALVKEIAGDRNRRKRNLAGIASVAVALVLTQVAAQARSANPEERAVRTLISQWVTAYQHLDGKRIASLERADVEVVDRFGQLHLPAGRQANARLWSDAFEMVSRESVAPTATIQRIRFIASDAAVVQVSWRFEEGILLVGGERIPPYSQLDTYVVIRAQGVWLVASHNMQERNKGETK